MSSGLIFEGPDGSGKSYTAEYISSAVGLPIHHFGGPPQTQDEMEKRLEILLSIDNVIFDRIPYISEQIYGPIVRGKALIDLTDWEFKIPFPVIYCRPSKETILKTQLEVKPHKSKEHLDSVKENLEKIISSYDQLMDKIPHIKFNRDKYSLVGLYEVVIRKL